MIDRRLLKREASNIVMLFNIAKYHGLKVFFWSFTDGICRRFHLNAIYHKTHYMRHEVCKDYLKKKYSAIIDKYKDVKVENLNKVGSDSPIWRYWHQGIENVPYPVDITLNSVYNKSGNHCIKILDSNSYGDYIDIPDYIVSKCNNGQMNIAVFSDYLRIALLREYGGIWLDSTFYVDEKFPRKIDEMDFYTINQGGGRDWVVTRDKWSVGLLACGKENPLISFCEEFLREYWKNEKTPIAYLMTDCIIGIAYDEIPAFKKMIDAVPENNTHCFDFLSEFRNEDYDKVKQNMMKQDTYIYQLSYKYDWNKSGPSGGLSNFGGLIEKCKKKVEKV